MSEDVQSTLRLQLAIDKAIADDWELIKDTAGTAADRRDMFDLALQIRLARSN